MKLIIVLAAFILSASADPARYDNYRLYSVSVENNLQIKVLKELSETSDSVKLPSNF